MPWAPAFISNTSPELYTTLHFFKVLPHLSATSGHTSSAAPVLPMGRRLHYQPHSPEEEGAWKPTCHPSQGSLLHRQGDWISRQASLGLGGAQQLWVSEVCWQRDRGRMGGPGLGSELAEVPVFPEYRAAVWQEHSSGAGCGDGCKATYTC